MSEGIVLNFGSIGFFAATINERCIPSVGVEVISHKGNSIGPGDKCLAPAEAS